MRIKIIPTKILLWRALALTPGKLFIQNDAEFFRLPALPTTPIAKPAAYLRVMRNMQNSSLTKELKPQQSPPAICAKPCL